MHESARSYVSEVHSIATKAIDGGIGWLQALVDEIQTSSGTLVLAGVGGSATVLANFHQDVANMKGNLKAHLACDNPARLSKIGNEKGWEEIFSAQLDMVFCPKILLVSSFSFETIPVLRAIERAEEINIKVFSLGSNPEVRMSTYLYIPASTCDHFEDVVSVVLHFVAREVARKEP